MPELAFERQARPLVSHIVVAVGHHRHRVDIGALPDHMDMLAAMLLVQHDRAGLAVKAKLFFETVNGDFPLISRHRVAGVRVDVGVIKALAAPRAGGDELPGRAAHRSKFPVESSCRISTRSFVSVRWRCRNWLGPARLEPLMIIGRGFHGFHPECGKDGVADVEIGGESFFQLGDVDLPARVQVLGDLVQIVADAAAMTKDLTQCDMVCRRTALHLGAAVAVEGGGAHECRETKPGPIGLRGNSVEFVVGVAQRTPLFRCLLSLPDAMRPPTEQDGKPQHVRIYSSRVRPCSALAVRKMLIGGYFELKSGCEPHRQQSEPDRQAPERRRARSTSPSWKEALAAILDIRNAILTALGMKTTKAPP